MKRMKKILMKMRTVMASMNMEMMSPMTVTNRIRMTCQKRQIE
ncbi:unnamed protein product [Anisakis simplex]|uniref:Alternative protein n=1 Tax=Anisakis simplex TaxID=6269 RepID=A0A0M3JFF4_ANISI|nr:unnamed protein product [Anisakis simplex]